MLIVFLIILSVILLISIYSQSLAPLFTFGTTSLIFYFTLHVLFDNRQNIELQTAPSSIARLDIGSKAELTNTDIRKHKSSLETLKPIPEQPQSTLTKPDNERSKPDRPTPSRGTSDYF
ncbi:hypothetical protein DV532_28890 (plasmid) [Pseudomonas sp. Leaf58]|nr:hypothetical protein DV532_28890 [Pseudomonas sp. Leaf58]KQN62171.1 hypothetical protein ASF02_08380 [Pseudomonas sp. Leaf58]